MTEPILKSRCGIVAAASWTVDRVKLVDAWPLEEHLAEIVDTDRQGGGSAHNLGVDIRRLDISVPVEAIGLIGNDADGDYLIELASTAGIDMQQLHRTESASTSFTDVISDTQSGKRTFFHHRGTNDLLTPQHFDFTRCTGKFLHLGLLGLHKSLDTSDDRNGVNGWVSVLQQAQSAGLKTNIELVSIDPERIRAIALPCLPYLDTLIANEFEAGSLAEVETLDAEGRVNPQLCIDAAKRILQLGDMWLVVVHYPGGAVAVTRDNVPLLSHSFDVPDSAIASSVGAGDAFAAGMLYGLHENWSIEQSLELAHATAASSLRATNTVGAVGTVEECLRYAKTLEKAGQ